MSSTPTFESDLSPSHEDRLRRSKTRFDQILEGVAGVVRESNYSPPESRFFGQNSAYVSPFADRSAGMLSLEVL